MKKIFLFVWMSMFLMSACNSSTSDHGHEVSGTGVEAHDPWARSVPQGSNTAVYMLLHNHSEEADALTGASTDVASSVEMHLGEVDVNDVARMTLQETVELPADGDVEFSPGGYHFMLVDLKKDLNKGDEITFVLHFQHHEDISLTVPVLESEALEHQHH